MAGFLVIDQLYMVLDQLDKLQPKIMEAPSIAQSLAEAQLNADIASLVDWSPGNGFERCLDGSWRIGGYINSVVWPPSYVRSIDAAMSLVPQEYDWTLEKDAAWVRWMGRQDIEEVNGVLFGWDGKGTAVALCIAALLARRALKFKQEKVS